uniref:Transporter 2, ATP binding cassette subfamily B member n=1 Tax=Loxodonta africana TaxID=9785 RepID=G3UDM5_LOXAF
MRALVPGALRAPPVRVASAPWSWLLASYGAVALSWALWAVLSPQGAPASAQERKQGQENKALMWRLLKLSRPDLPFLAAAFFFLVMAVWGETLIPYYSGRVIDILGGDFDPEAFTSAIFFMCLFSFGSSLSAGCRGGSFLFTMSRINLRIRELLFSSLLRQDLGFFQEIKTGELNSRLSSDTTLMSRWLPFNANVLLRSLVKVVGLYSFMLSLSPRLTLLSLLNVPLSLAVDKVYNSRHQALLEVFSALRAEVLSWEVGDFPRVENFYNQKREFGRKRDIFRRSRMLWQGQDSSASSLSSPPQLLQLAVQVLMLSCGLQQILAGDLTQGGLLSFLLYQEDVGHHYIHTRLVYMWGDMLSNVGAAKKVFCYLDRKPNLPPLGTLAPSTLKGNVEFRDVSFAYPNRPDQPVLKGLTFTLSPGEETALVGPNGSGKSTVAALLQNLYQPTGGQLLLDGKPISEYEHRYLHRKVVLVGQEPVLFGSVRDNIAYGLENCKDEVMAAAKDAHADKFIAEMEHGMHTDVGEKGSQLAAGQKQCLAIARALVRDPQVLILDEATSALDAECEKAEADEWSTSGN